MAYNLSAFAGAGAQFFDSNGTPLVGGLLYVYTAGTTTPATSWTTNSGASANTNPIVLNAAGRTPFEIWLNSGVTYKFALYTATGVLIGTYDNIPAIDDPTVFNNLITVTGTNALIGTSVPPYTSYVAGMTLSFVPVATNTGAVTLDLDGLGAKNLFLGSATTLVGGELVAGRIAQIEYDGTRFQLYQSTINNVVTLTDNQSIAGVKTFTDPMIIESSDAAGANLKLTGTSGSPAAPNKYIRSLAGVFEVVNSAFTAPLIQVYESGDFAFNAGYGTSKVAYGCRAWVNFDGTGTVAIRGSGGVSSITDNGTGDYTVNFSTALVDANYAITATASVDIVVFPTPTTSLARLVTTTSTTGAATDSAFVYVAIHR